MQRMLQSFVKFVPPAVVSMLVGKGKEAALGGKRMDITVCTRPRHSHDPGPPMRPTATLHGSGLHVPVLLKPSVTGVMHSTVRLPLPTYPVAQSTSQLLPYSSA
jgi:hypothetical protein